jgi:hypothetical protein
LHPGPGLPGKSVSRGDEFHTRPRFFILPEVV